MMLAINVISLVVVDLLPVVVRELTATWLGVLPRDPANESDRTAMLALHQFLGLFIIGHFIYIGKKVPARMFFSTC
jgi:hypothetical protein